jgi:pimeloyl-ACP methyl ester carboxylesterase
MTASSENIDLHRRHLVGAAAAAVAAAQLGMFAAVASEQKQKADIGFIEIDQDITLRRMVVHNPAPKGTVLFLHGFPETLYAWKDISLALADHYEVHAFDWPGYGLSSRPTAGRFSYAPKDYARVLGEYIRKAGIDTSKLTIYATDIGALPALLLALEKPDIAKTIIVGDFAPFNRPRYMYESLQNLKAGASADQARAQLNKNRDDVLENAFRRGLPKEAQFEVSREFKDDMSRGWNHGAITTADAFSHYYSHFSRDQDHFEAQLDRLKTPVKVVWGESDLYIRKEMGVELAERIRAALTILPGIGHYPHLQNPKHAIDEVRASFRSARAAKTE